jgi:hypothetical protein
MKYYYFLSCIISCILHLRLLFYKSNISYYFVEGYESIPKKISYHNA